MRDYKKFLKRLSLSELENEFLNVREDLDIFKKDFNVKKEEIRSYELLIKTYKEKIKAIECEYYIKFKEGCGKRWNI